MMENQQYRIVLGVMQNWIGPVKTYQQLKYNKIIYNFLLVNINWVVFAASYISSVLNYAGIKAFFYFP